MDIDAALGHAVSQLCISGDHTDERVAEGLRLVRAHLSRQRVANGHPSQSAAGLDQPWRHTHYGSNLQVRRDLPPLAHAAAVHMSVELGLDVRYTNGHWFIATPTDESREMAHRFSCYLAGLADALGFTS